MSIQFIATVHDSCGALTVRHDCNEHVSSIHHEMKIQSAVFVPSLMAVVFFALSGCASIARSIKQDAHLPGIRLLLEGFAKAKSPNNIDYFYITPVSRDEGPIFAYAYWLSGNSIIILQLPLTGTPTQADFDWYDGKARIDLAKDVVPTRDDVGGSTYLVDTGWVEKIIRDALNSGTKVVVRK